MTYELDGEQYITVNAGWGGAFALVFGEYVQAESLPNVSRVLTFKLGANKTLPPVEWKPSVTFDPPPQTADATTLRKGFAQYQDNCMGCHGLNAVSGLLIPDLRGSGYLHDAKAWRSVVLGGALAERGMPSLAESLTEDQAEAVRAYVIQQAHRGAALRQQQQNEQKPGSAP
jgi:mono/diheme cytochrome c family protein